LIASRSCSVATGRHDPGGHRQLRSSDAIVCAHRRGTIDNHDVPRLSTFYGIVIYMYRPDHPPPHFHAQYGEHIAQIDLASL
jgi:hypothetical protein